MQLRQLVSSVAGFSLLLAALKGTNLFVDSNWAHIFANYDNPNSNSLGSWVARYKLKQTHTQQRSKTSSYPTEPIVIHSNESISDIDALLSSNRPVLLKNFIKDPRLGHIVDEIGHLSQNLFWPCTVRPPPVLGEVKPCLGLPLREQVDLWYKANDSDTVNIVHTLATHRGTYGHVRGILSRMGVRSSIVDWAEKLRFSPVLGTFLAWAGQTNVDYFHAHQDDFMSLNVEGVKVWELVHPDGLPYMKPKWSGVSLVLQMDPTNADHRREHGLEVPVVKVVQEVGDILFNPAWYAHRTANANDDEDGVSASINLHLVPNDFAGFLHNEIFARSYPRFYHELFSPLMTKFATIIR